MKMRQFKLAKLATMSYTLYGPLGPQGFTTPLVSAFREGMRQEPAARVLTVGAMPSAVEAVMAASKNVAQAPAKFVVKRVRDGEIVDEFETREEALGLVLKHARQKKAKLYATYAGKDVLFSKEEILNNAVPA